MTVRATWRDAVIAESDHTILVEGNQYFPVESLMSQFFEKSESTTFCTWKGVASYYHVVVGEDRNVDSAWYYEDPYEAASAISGYVAFWKGVEVSGVNADTQEILPSRL